jgi:hypothetical protein
MTWRILVPLILAFAAGLINFVVVYGLVAPLELVAVNQDVKAGETITEAMLDRLTVRADRKLFASVVAYPDRGVIIGGRLSRALKSGEAVLFTDVQLETSDDFRNALRPEEDTMTIAVRPPRIAPGLRQGDQVIFTMPAPAGAADPSPRRLGPFRLLGFGERGDAFQAAALNREETRKVVVARPAKPSTEVAAMIQALQEAVRLALADSKLDPGLAVEYSGPPPR